jgi:hypothetical protein
VKYTGSVKLEEMFGICGPGLRFLGGLQLFRAEWIFGHAAMAILEAGCFFLAIVILPTFQLGPWKHMVELVAQLMQFEDLVSLIDLIGLPSLVMTGSTLLMLLDGMVEQEVLMTFPRSSSDLLRSNAILGRGNIHASMQLCRRHKIYYLGCVYFLIFPSPALGNQDLYLFRDWSWSKCAKQ